MATRTLCDWCAQEIDEDESLSADELDRLGLSDESVDQFVVIEVRFNGSTYLDRVKRRDEILHFHHPHCFHDALDLIADHRRWAEQRATGRRGAALPGWESDGLTAAPGVVQRAEKSELTKPVSDDPFHGLGARVALALRRAGFHSVDDLAGRSQADLLALPNVGAGSVDHVMELLEARGLGLTGPTPDEVGKRLRGLRLAAGLSHAELARELRGAVPPGEEHANWHQRLCQWEAGRKMPDDTAAEALAGIYAVSPGFLMCREKDGA